MRIEGSPLQEDRSLNPWLCNASANFVSAVPAGKLAWSRFCSSGDVATGRPSCTRASSELLGGQAPHKPPPAETSAKSAGVAGLGPAHPVTIPPDIAAVASVRAISRSDRIFAFGLFTSRSCVHNRPTISPAPGHRPEVSHTGPVLYPSLLGERSCAYKECPVPPSVFSLTVG